MGDFAWSFLNRIRDHEIDKRLVGEFSFSRSLLSQLNLSVQGNHVPEGLLIECCAQAAGLALMLEKEGIEYLPILARVNTCDFHSPVPLDQDAIVEADLLYQTESNAAEFRATIRLSEESSPCLECRVLLGLTKLTDLPDSGVGILAHFEGLKLSFIDA